VLFTHPSLPPSFQLKRRKREGGRKGVAERRRTL
jgi:hypothetical protein